MPLLSRLHLERVVEAIEVIEQPDGAHQLHDFAFIEVSAHVGPELVVDSVSVAGNALGQAQRDLLFFREVGPVFEVGQFPNLLFAVAVPSRLDGMRSQSILAAVDLRGAHEEQFFELGRHRARLHDRAEMLDHGAQQLRPVGDGAEHVGNIPSRFQKMVEDLPGLGRNLGTVKS